VAEIILSPETIEYTGIDSPDYVLVISEDGLKRVRSKIGQLSESCVLYVDESLDVPETRAQVRRLPFSQIGKQVSKLSVATGALAAMLKDSGLFPIGALETAIETFQSPSIAETSRRAVSAGSGLV
jgi:Pyruvate/2-oxoacid:ferredoxin oxidoreductase gamma subunit